MPNADVANDLIDRWFGAWNDDEPLPPGDPSMSLWWAKSDATDDALRRRFATAHLAEAADVDAPDLLADPVRAVARVVLLDQIPRNIYRGTAHMFATDGLARATTARLLDAPECFAALPRVHRYFVLMPWMHSEDLADHDRAVAAFDALARDASATARHGVYASACAFEARHRAIIARFGRYPHRNALLGRASTEAEVAFLAEPGSSF